MVTRGMVGSVFRGMFFFLFWRLGSLVLSFPAWILLILHFTLDISIWWFWGYLIAWFVIGILRYLLIVFSRACVKDEREKVDATENKNPYSHKGNVV